MRVGAKMSPTPHQFLSSHNNQTAEKLQLQTLDFTEKRVIACMHIAKNKFLCFITQPKRIYVIHFNSKKK